MNASAMEILRALDSVDAFESYQRRTAKAASYYAARHDRQSRKRERAASPRVAAQSAFYAEAR